MTRQQVEDLLSEIGAKRNLDSFVVLGSLVVYGLSDSSISADMTTSNEVGGYPEINPQSAFDLSKEWGQGSKFEEQNGFYFDAIAPTLPTLPDDWRSRLLIHKTRSGVTIKFAEPNDVAISKYARGEAKDREWIRSGLAASILSLATMEYRLGGTHFLDQAEHERVKGALEEDRAWLSSIREATPP